MLRYGLVLAALAAVLVTAQDAKDLEQFHVVYEWYKLDYTWPDDTTKVKALSSSQFIPENNAISGVKVYRDRLYLTVPRWRTGVPATLVSIAATSPDSNASPKLEPFPSWGMQEIGNCSALQFVQNVEIDPQGRMWILDTGRINVMGQSEPKCPPKIVMIDLNQDNAQQVNFNNQGNQPGSSYSYNNPGKNMKTAPVIRTFILPDDVVSKTASYLADLVLDPTDGWYAYITDGGDADPGIIVYSYRENRAWKVRDNRSMLADPSLRSFRVNNDNVQIQQNVYPLALDIQQKVVYYSPLSSLNMFSIPTSVLKDSSSRDAPGHVRDLGKKLGLSEGFAMDNRGVLYYGLIDNNGVAKWDSKTPFGTNQHIISQDKVRLQWPSGFGFDNVGNLWLVSNRMQNYISNRVNLDEPNYRLIRGLTGTKSYLFTEMSEDKENWSSSTYATNKERDEENSLRLLSNDTKDGMDTGNSGAGFATATPLSVLVVLLCARVFA